MGQLKRQNLAYRLIPFLLCFFIAEHVHAGCTMGGKSFSSSSACQRALSTANGQYRRAGGIGSSGLSCSCTNSTTRPSRGQEQQLQQDAARARENMRQLEEQRRQEEAERQKRETAKTREFENSRSSLLDRLNDIGSSKASGSGQTGSLGVGSSTPQSGLAILQARCAASESRAAARRALAGALRDAKEGASGPFDGGGQPAAGCQSSTISIPEPGQPVDELSSEEVRLYQVLEVEAEKTTKIIKSENRTKTNAVRKKLRLHKKVTSLENKIATLRGQPQTQPIKEQREEEEKELAKTKDLLAIAEKLRAEAASKEEEAKQQLERLGNIYTDVEKNPRNAAKHFGTFENK